MEANSETKAIPTRELPSLARATKGLQVPHPALLCHHSLQVQPLSITAPLPGQRDSHIHTLSSPSRRYPESYCGLPCLSRQPSPTPLGLISCYLCRGKWWYTGLPTQEHIREEKKGGQIVSEKDMAPSVSSLWVGERLLRGTAQPPRGTGHSPLGCGGPYSSFSSPSQRYFGKRPSAAESRWM